MTDLVDNFFEDRQQARQATVVGVDGNPDEAARAVELGQATGVPPSIISGDLENFERNSRARLASDIINNNPHLADYINSNPMASRVSNDDYGNLDSLTGAVATISNHAPVVELPKPEQPILQQPLTPSMQRTVAAFREGFGEGPLGQWLIDNPQTLEYLNAMPEWQRAVAYAGWSILGAPIELGARVFSGGLRAANEEIRSNLSVYMRENDADRLARDLTGMLEFRLMQPTGPQGHLPGPREMLAARQEVLNMIPPIEGAYRASQPYIEAGRPVPPGVDAFIDQHKIKEVRGDMEGLAEAQRQAQASLTRERSPEMFADLVRRQTDAEISVPFDAIFELYKDKLPEPNDGLLGWVPDITTQWNIALATGGDIRVPLSEWLARVEPGVARELHDNIRVRRNGLTIEEAKVWEDIEVFHGSPHSFDAFSMERIGTGEGAQSYGHGLYFAENRGVAESYQKMAQRKADWSSTDPERMPPGNMYRVRIRGNPEDFLDWDRALGEQPEAMKRLQALQPFYEAITPERTGQSFYELLQGTNLTTHGREKYGRENLMSREQASNALREAGIPGIRYLDQGSRPTTRSLKIEEAKGPEGENLFTIRGTDKGSEYFATRAEAEARLRELEPQTYNYVLFDDSLIEILDRNGEAVQSVRRQAGFEPLTDIGGEGELKQYGRFRTRIEGEARQYSPEIQAFVPKEFTGGEIEIIRVVEKELAKIIPNYVETQPTLGLRRDASKVNGVMIQYKDRLPIILYALNTHDPIGTARHEAIHALRHMGFFTEAEWATLERASREEGWTSKQRGGEGTSISERYSHVEDQGRILEETIADEFKYWTANPDSPTLASAVFKKIRDFLNSIKEAITALRTTNPSVAEIFKAIESGEIGRREPKPIDPNAFDPIVRTEEPRQGELDVTRQNDKAIFEKAAAMGRTVAQYREYMRLIAERSAEDIAAQRERAREIERRQQTAEWKAESAAMQEQVTNDLRQRPDISAVNMFRYGELFGEKVAPGPRLSEEFLTPEQRAALPKQWISKDGIHPDDAASLFGYANGTEMIQRMTAFETARGDTRPGAYFDRLVTAETERRMIEKHGLLGDNILSAAEDHVLSPTQMDLLHENTVAMGMKAGIEISITKEDVQRMVAEKFNKELARNADAQTYLTDGGRAWRAMEAAFLKQDWAEAFRQAQRQQWAGLLAREAKAFEKETARFERLTDRFEKAVVKGTNQDYTNAIRFLMGSADIPIIDGLAHVRDEMAANGFPTMEGFVNSSRSAGWEPAVPESMYTQVKNITSMTVEERREFSSALQSLRHIGREVEQINLAGEKMEFNQFIAEAIETLKTLPERTRESQERGLMHRLWGWDASLTRMEEIILDMSNRDPNHPLYQAVMAPMLEAKSKEFDMITALSQHFKESRADLGKKWERSLRDTIPNELLIDPYTMTPYAMTREHLLNVMLQWGNESNILKLSRGYASLELGRLATKEEAGVFARRIKAMIDEHATRQDWQFVEAMWKPFKTWEPDLNALSRNTSGVAPVLIKAQAVDTPFGKIEGGYWPVKYDKLSSKLELSRSTSTEGLFGETYARATTPKGYLEARTGYTDFVDIIKSVEQAAGTMQQAIHDISFREAVIQVNKVFSNPKLKDAMNHHYGREYTKQMEPWLERVAKRFPNDPSVEEVNRLLSRLRVNLIAHAMPFNLPLWLSPDIGGARNMARLINPVDWVNFVANYKENHAIAQTHSQEIRHLVYNFDRDYRNHIEQLQGKDGFTATYQRKVIEWGFKPIMALSQQFRELTFVDFFRAEKAKGATDAEAARVGDYHVRERHGAASMVDLPALMAKDEAWKLMTLFHGYQSTMYNWQRQLPGNLRRGEYSAGANTLTGTLVIGSLFGMWLYNNRREGESWLHFIAKSLLIQPLSTVPLVRDLGNLAFEGYDSRTPLGSLASSVRSLAYDALRVSEGRQANAPIKNLANVVGMSTGSPLNQAGRTGQWSHDINRGKQQRPRDFIEWQRGIIRGQTRLKK